MPDGWNEPEYIDYCRDNNFEPVIVYINLVRGKVQMVEGRVIGELNLPETGTALLALKDQLRREGYIVLDPHPYKEAYHTGPKTGKK